MAGRKREIPCCRRGEFPPRRAASLSAPGENFHPSVTFPRPAARHGPVLRTQVHSTQVAQPAGQPACYEPLVRDRVAPTHPVPAKSSFPLGSNLRPAVLGRAAPVRPSVTVPALSTPCALAMLHGAFGVAREGRLSLIPSHALPRQPFSPCRFGSPRDKCLPGSCPET
jgi:hypothetical protein